MTPSARPNGHAAAGQASDPSYEGLVRKRRHGPQSKWLGRRVYWIAGPNKGTGGRIVEIISGNTFRVRTDSGRLLTPDRASVALSDEGNGVVEGATPASMDAARRVLSLFAREPDLRRVVVFLTPKGHIGVRRYVERDYGPGMLGVFTRAATFEQLAQELVA